jgi:glucokinase
MKKYAFGVDIGGTTVKIGLFDKDGCVLDKWEIPTVKDNGGDSVLPDIADSIKEKMQEKGIDQDDIEGGSRDDPSGGLAQALAYADGQLPHRPPHLSNVKQDSVQPVRPP